jgi:uncharacterized protein
MPFVIEAIDRAGHLETRLANRAAHLEHLAGVADKVIAAGPLLGADGKPVGSLIILDLPDLAAMQGFVSADPYSKADLFETVTIRPWVRVYPKD